MKFLKWLLISLLVILLLFFAIAFFLPDKFSVERSIVIDAAPDEIYGSVIDLERFVEWDPWSEQDPEMKLVWGDKKSGPGASYDWSSETMGGGTLQIVGAVPLRRVDYQIFFEGQRERPANGSFIITRASSDTGNGFYELRWTFSGRLGYPVDRYVGLLLDSMVGASFERGLGNLKGQLEGVDAAEETGED